MNISLENDKYTLFSNLTIRIFRTLKKFFKVIHFYNAQINIQITILLKSVISQKNMICVIIPPLCNTILIIIYTKPPFHILISVFLNIIKIETVGHRWVTSTRSIICVTHMWVTQQGTC